MNARVQQLVNAVISQFDARTKTEGKKHGVDYGISLSTKIDTNNVLWLTFSKGEENHSVTTPLPFEKDGVVLLQQNEVLRAVCPFWIEQDGVEVDYVAALYKVLLGTPAGFVPNELVKATPYVQQIIFGFNNGNASIIIYRLQRAINEIVNKMPLHETMMNSFVMNNRLIIIDKEFDEIASPAGRLEYQVNKARKYFNNGWTSIGLSDGSLADKNYILKGDLRRLSPFGVRYHNPQRNLYSTLGMKGDELPIIRSRTMQDLMDKGITRKGWNLFTAFVDIPDIFEDQIMVDESLTGKFVEYVRRYQVYGNMLVASGQALKTGEAIGVAPDQEPVIFDTICDSARISKVIESTVAVGGVPTKVYNVVISYRRYFRDGLKITNLHGNKGVIRIAKLGHAVDPRTGKIRKIDVIVGAKTVGKRKNYGQIMEALTNCIVEADTAENGLSAAWASFGHHKTVDAKPLVLENDWHQPMEEVVSGLKRRGFREDGTWDCKLYVGNVKAVCGTVFWGCIKTAEDQMWDEDATISRNGKEVRTAGLKFSHVEFRAIETRFGNESAVLDEIMSYVQGTENLHEMLAMLRSKVGEYPEGKTVVGPNSVKPMDQTTGTIVSGLYIGGTVVDEFLYPEGFIFGLPLAYQSLLESDGSVVHEGSPLVLEQLSPEQRAKITEVYTTDRLYFPSGILRKCWRHDTGKYGLSEIGVIVNNVVLMTRKLLADANNPINHRMYYNAISTYFDKLSKMLGSKRGEIATHAMAVRYPFSAKAVATLSTVLPKNTVEIHRDMAKVLHVGNGDIVIAERFPCLGFMSVRPQKVRVTDDPMCKYVIRVSGNSLVSQNLDFDGDVLFLAAFHTPAAKAELLREWTNPNKTCYEEIQQLNNRKGAPHVKEYALKDFGITPFSDMTSEQHAAIVEKNTGVKAQTGPVIALTYNIMRIVENSNLAKDQKMKVAIEMFLEKAAQSVFEQKHGGKSLYDIVIDGVCTADVDLLVSVGFKRGTTEKLCELIVNRAESLGVFNLKAFHEKATKAGSSNMISTIVKNQNRIYFASRSRLEGIALLKAVEAPAVDIPSKMFKWAMAGKIGSKKTMLEIMMEQDKISSKLKGESYKEAANSMLQIIDSLQKNTN